MGGLRRDVVAASRGGIVEIAAGTGLNFPCYPAGVVVVATEPDLASVGGVVTRFESSSLKEWQTSTSPRLLVIGDDGWRLY
jgi:hypothetical protein